MPPKSMANEAKQRQAHLNNHANQLNSNNDLHRPKHESDGLKMNEAAIQHRAKQLNPNNSLYRAPKK